MTPPTQYHVRIREEVRGPFGISQLRDLAEVQVITPATDAAVSVAGPWFPLGTAPESALVFPPRVQLAFKPATEPPALREAAQGVDLREVLAAANRNVSSLRFGGDSGAIPPVGPSSSPPNEIQAMVAEVSEREARFAPPSPPPPPKKWLSSRLKLTLLLAVVGNSTLAAIPIWYDALDDSWAMLVFKAWFITFNGALVIAYFTQPKT